MPQIITYHCICTQFLLATPYSLSALPSRAPPAAAGTRILPLGRPPTLDSHPENDDEEDVHHSTDPNSTVNDSSPHPPIAPSNPLRRLSLSEARDPEPKILYSLMLNTTVDRRPVIVRREDGFEKRWVKRCARCRTGIGYVLGLQQQEMGGSGDAGGGVMYLLEEGLVETKALRAGTRKEVAGD